MPLVTCNKELEKHYDRQRPYAIAGDHSTTGRNAIAHDVIPYQHNGHTYPACWWAAAAIVPMLDIDEQARYVGASWALRRLGP